MHDGRRHLGGTSRRHDAGDGRGHDGRRSGRLHRVPPGQGRRVGDRRGQGGRPGHRVARRRQGCHRHRRQRGRPGRPAPLHRPRHGPGRAPVVAGRQVRHRPGDRERVLLRLRAPRRCALQRRRPRADRGRDARDRPGGPALRPPRAHAGRRDWRSSPTSRSSRRSSRPSVRAPTRSTPPARR